MRLRSPSRKLAEEYIEAFERTEDQLLRERTSDIHDIVQRLLRHLLGIEEKERTACRKCDPGGEGSDLVGPVYGGPGALKGVVLGSGGATSHASILAKSFEIPTVVGVDHAELVQEDDDCHCRWQFRGGVSQPGGGGLAGV